MENTTVTAAQAATEETTTVAAKATKAKQSKAAKASTSEESAAKPTKRAPVRIKLFKDNDRYKSDVFVSVNGRNYQIRRGVEMEVPAEVAEVLEHSQTQDEITARRIEQASEQAKL
ncbi:MAG: hypothetical protein R3Y06_07655 [Faecalibacterium sp.]